MMMNDVATLAFTDDEEMVIFFDDPVTTSQSHARKEAGRSIYTHVENKENLMGDNAHSSKYI